jgi:L-glyceraldehyde 3-phosphate reductase
VLRDDRITSALIGASRTSQLDDLVRCLDAAPFTDAELAEIDTYAVDGGINIWTASSDA